MPDITLVTGSFPPDKCGVGDYTAQLLRAFRHIGLQADCYAERDWQLRNLAKHWRRLCGRSGTLLMQHPTSGFDKRFAPFLIWPLLFWKRKVVTLHEFSKKTLLGKMLCYAFFLFSYRVVFTNDAERAAALRFAPWLKNRSAVIPIGSNIPFIAHGEDSADVAYFGLILPGKGVEEFLAIADQLAAHNSLRIQLIGQVFKGAEAFAEQALQKLEKIGARIVLNAEPEVVAEHLATSRIVLLPFPDGISSRRGSALAAMGNGALVVSTVAQAELATFQRCCLMGETPERLVELVEEALADPARFVDITQAGQRYARSFDWNQIAAQHIELLRRQSVPVY